MILFSMLQYFQGLTNPTGPALQPGQDLQNLVNTLFASKVGIVALAGGGQAGATPLPAALNSVDTCASDSDSVILPLAIAGQSVRVLNNTGHTLAVFGQASNPALALAAGDTIAAHNSNIQQPTATGVTQATTVPGEYTCYVNGQWKQSLG